MYGQCKCKVLDHLAKFKKLRLNLGISTFSVHLKHNLLPYTLPIVLLLQAPSSESWAYNAKLKAQNMQVKNYDLYDCNLSLAKPT